MKSISMTAAICGALLAACGHDGATRTAGTADDPVPPAGAPSLVVTSNEFKDGAAVPIAHTCDGADVAPSLAWTGAPATTKSFAVIVDDPDAPDPAAPKQTWVHWVLVNVPQSVTSLPVGAGLSPPAGASNGTNDWGKAEWRGPCPPIGRHHYRFQVYALDAELGTPGITKPALLAAIAGHVVARGVLVGTYQKQ
jgi:hypothetical protein